MVDPHAAADRRTPGAYFPTRLDWTLPGAVMAAVVIAIVRDQTDDYAAELGVLFWIPVGYLVVRGLLRVRRSMNEHTAIDSSTGHETTVYAFYNSICQGCGRWRTLRPVYDVPDIRWHGYKYGRKPAGLPDVRACDRCVSTWLEENECWSKTDDSLYLQHGDWINRRGSRG